VVVAAIWGFASATPATASAPCWKQIVRDWSDGRIDGTYSVSCYRLALARMPEDLRVYSSAPDDIESALQRSVHHTGARTLALSRGSAQQTDSRPSSRGRLAALVGGLAAVFGAGAVIAARRARRL